MKSTNKEKRVEPGISPVGCAVATDYVITVGTLNKPLGTILPESEAIRALLHGRLGLR